MKGLLVVTIGCFYFLSSESSSAILQKGWVHVTLEISMNMK
jgi:hypothetical protein